MDRTELKAMLDKLGIHDSIYSLYGERGIDKIILEWGIMWRIYGIDERGGEHEEAKFETEGEACEYFYNMMVKFKKNMDDFNDQIPFEPPKIEKRIFVVSNTGTSEIKKDE